MLVLGLFAGFGLLSGCATAPDGSRGATAPGEQASALLSGRLALRVDDPSARPRSVTAAFELRGDAQSGSLDLASPLGSRIAEARWGADGAWLTTTEGVRQFASLDELALQALGDPVPLSALPDWLRGRPAPEAAHGPWRDGGAAGFEQAGWRVDLSARAEGQVVLTRGPDGASAATITLRVRMDP